MVNKENFKEFEINGKNFTYKDFLIQEQKQYLNDTDYAIIKMYEEFVQGGSITQMLAEYKETLVKRKEARQLINELETEIKQNEENNNTND